MKVSGLSLVISTAIGLSACGGGGSSSNPAMSSTPETGSLSALLQTGVDASDTNTQWDCAGSDGQDPVTFSQQFFSNGEGQVLQLGVPVPFTWTADSDTTFSVTFPGDATFPAETLSISNVSFSTIFMDNDQYQGIDSRDGSALTCTKSQTSSAPAVTAPLSTLIVNTLEPSDGQWLCTIENLPGTNISYQFSADGTGFRFGSDAANGDPSIIWTADEDNAAINFMINGMPGSLGAIMFQDDSTFTAADGLENDNITCTRSEAPNAPEAPPQPQLATSCPCGFEEVEQFLTDSAEPSTTIFRSDIPGGTILDISLPGTTFQLTSRNLGVRDCSVSFTGTSFAGENNENQSGYPQVRADTCEAELDRIFNAN